IAAKSALLDNIGRIAARDGQDRLAALGAALLALGEGSGNIFELRETELAAEAKAEVVLANSRKLATELAAEVDRLVGLAGTELSTGTASSDAAIAGGKFWLLAIAGVSLIFSLALAWLYVGRNLIARLAAVASSMQEIAGGRLDTEVA